MQKEVYEFISQQLNDPIIERRTCEASGTLFAIFQSDIDKLKKLEPKIGGKSFELPLPTLCPEERQKRRLTFRNIRTLYRGKSALSGKNLITMFNPQKHTNIFTTQERHSDARNPLDHGQEFDFNKTFTEQFAELQKKIPKPALSVFDIENSPYVSQCWHLKNCHLCYDVGYCENCMYDQSVYHSNKVIDSFIVDHSELCYECIMCKGCFQCFFCKNSLDCSDSYFLRGCANCKNCFGCINVSNKEYCIYNKQYTKEEYQEKISTLNLTQHDQLEKIRSQSEGFSDQFPYKNLLMHNSENCIGHNVVNSKNCICTNLIFGSEDLKYVYNVDSDIKDAMDLNNGVEGSRIYNSVMISGENIFFSRMAVKAQNCLYCNDCWHGNNFFGCDGIHSNIEYCIFNKQYTKQEYEIVVPKIIEHMKSTGEWGKYFDQSLSPFGYNETAANEAYPLTKEEAFKQGYYRIDQTQEITVPQGMKTIEGKNIGNISSDEEILNSAIICEESGKPFRIIKQELEFLHKYKIALPIYHPDIRHQKRFNKVPGRDLYLRNCDKTSETLLTVYPPDEDIKIWNAKDFDKMVYG